MNILRLLFELFVVYILYKLIFDFIIPVYKTSKQVKQKMNEMHQRMEQNNEPPLSSRNTSSRSQEAVKPQVKEDYIDYEEIK